MKTENRESDTRRMVETGTGSMRSTGSAVPQGIRPMEVAPPPSNPMKEPDVSELTRLAECCEQATGPDRELSADIYGALHDYEKRFNEEFGFHQYWKDGRWLAAGQMPHYTASLDAAMTLVPNDMGYVVGEGRCIPQEKLGGALITPSRAKPFDPDSPPVAVGEGHTAPLALCAAALRARASEQQDGGGK